MMKWFVEITLHKCGMFPFLKNCGILSIWGNVKYTEKFIMYVTDGDIQYSTRFFTEKGKLHIYWTLFLSTKSPQQVDTAVWDTGKHDDQYSEGRGNMTISIYCKSLSKTIAF